ncbi:26S proteasome non-ATPase regulatory subunit 6 [Raphidocelis subcapitata]|uniref:26S proteasome regulatory subunit RPN7 n=1 Tax=Raphidocelis subcapitata TaxID=307507 RepID=A0A2V0PCM5_9CHLO|nr:26S proteasome non-ATPase regulatory subunit 6 [Raphidocelis subcapitata]|eukprot:GBF97604.1 26S proteasome non-ATPase regulatory subunit 6 [Raphidocelis subcapitata]
MAQDEEKQDFRLELAQKVFLYKSKDTSAADRKRLQTEILDTCFKDALTPLYEHLCTDLGLPKDEKKVAEMRAINEAKLAELEAKFKDAEENLGETEVRDALHARAEYLGRIGDRAGAAKAYGETEERTASGGAKADMVFSQIRLAVLYDDWHAVKRLLARARAVCEAGGDWEHKNRLKVYEGVFAMYTRDFKRAAGLFLDSIATFTTSELFGYPRLITYAVLTGVVALDRPALKASVVDSPEVLAVIGGVPHLAPFLTCLYECKYAGFFKAFAGLMDLVRGDMYLAPHLRWYMREARLVAYSQFLESYKSVTLASMAAAFDVSTKFLDQELADFIVAGRLGAKIDGVAGVAEGRRPDARNAAYGDVIRRGDLLLNRIQKLSRVVDVE